MSSGRLFQATRPATQNARLPSCSLVLGTTKSPREAERRAERLGRVETDMQILFREHGEVPCTPVCRVWTIWFELAVRLTWRWDWALRAVMGWRSVEWETSRSFDVAEPSLRLHGSWRQRTYVRSRVHTMITIPTVGGWSGYWWQRWSHQQSKATLGLSLLGLVTTFRRL